MLLKLFHLSKIDFYRGGNCWETIQVREQEVWGTKVKKNKASVQYNKQNEHEGKFCWTKLCSVQISQASSKKTNVQWQQKY